MKYCLRWLCALPYVRFTKVALTDEGDFCDQERRFQATFIEHCDTMGGYCKNLRME